MASFDMVTVDQEQELHKLNSRIRRVIHPGSNSQIVLDDYHFGPVFLLLFLHCIEKQSSYGCLLEY